MLSDRYVFNSILLQIYMSYYIYDIVIAYGEFRVQDIHVDTCRYI